MNNDARSQVNDGKVTMPSILNPGAPAPHSTETSAPENGQAGQGRPTQAVWSSFNTGTAQAHTDQNEDSINTILPTLNRQIMKNMKTLLEDLEDLKLSNSSNQRDPVSSAKDILGLINESQIWQINDDTFKPKITLSMFHPDQLKRIAAMATSQGIKFNEEKLMQSAESFSKDSLPFIRSIEDTVWRAAKIKLMTTNRMENEDFAPNAGMPLASANGNSGEEDAGEKDAVEKFREKIQGPVHMIDDCKTCKRFLDELYVLMGTTYNKMHADFSKGASCKQMGEHMSFQVMLTHIAGMDNMRLKHKHYKLDGNGCRLGAIPFVDIASAWSQKWSGDNPNTKGERSEDIMRIIWGTFQLPEGLLKMPPEAGGQYPTREQVEPFYELDDLDMKDASPPPGASAETDSEEEDDGVDVSGHTNNNMQAKRSAPYSSGALPPSNHVTTMQVYDPDLANRIPRPGMVSMGLNTKPVTAKISKKNHTLQDEPILAYRLLKSDREDKRWYCVQTTPQKVEYRTEDQCGGRCVWNALDKQKILQVNDSVNDVEFRNKIDRNQWGMDWVAISPEVSATPRKLPAIVCGVWWNTDDGSIKKAAVLRSKLQSNLSKDLVDRMIIQCAAPDNAQCGSVWDLLKLSNDAIDPINAMVLYQGTGNSHSRGGLNDSRSSAQTGVMLQSEQKQQNFFAAILQAQAQQQTLLIDKMMQRMDSTLQSNMKHMDSTMANLCTMMDKLISKQGSI